MGWWGTFPSQGDGTGDLFSEVNDCVTKKLREMFKKRFWSMRHKNICMWERIGLVQLLLQADFFVPVSIAKTCIDYFAELEKDAEWLKGWQPSIEKSFYIVKQAFEKLYKDEMSKRSCGPPPKFATVVTKEKGKFVFKKMERKSWARQVKKESAVLAPRDWLRKEMEAADRKDFKRYRECVKKGKLINAIPGPCS